jgi:hypothetical protein
MSLEEFENHRQEKKKPYAKVRSIMNYGMGILWITLGIFLLMPNKFGYEYTLGRDPLMKAFGGICILYGSFRIYRGYTKNY